MNKKRLIAMLSTVAIVATLFAGCGSSGSQSSTTDSGKKTESKIKVGLSTDEGGLNDKSFNQAADQGIKKAQKELGLDYKAIESKQKEDYEANLEALVQNQSNVTFGVGFQMESAMENIAKKYTDKKFALIDSVAVEDEKATKQVQLKNVESIMFKENEGSFLVGIIAGKMTKTNQIGFIGGKDFALINKFEAGFAAGVKAVNPTAAANLINRKNVKYADSFNDTNKGYELAKSLINNNCDVIYHAAGGVGIGMFKAVKEANTGSKKVWAIGVDMDQAQTLPQYAGIMLTSMMKRVDNGTYAVVKQVAENKFQGGTLLTLGLKEDGVGIAPSSSKNTPKDVLDLVNKYADLVKQGKIVVPETNKEVPSFNAPAVK